MREYVQPGYTDALGLSLKASPPASQGALPTKSDQPRGTSPKTLDSSSLGTASKENISRQ